jgi:hypothetical protein
MKELRADLFVFEHSTIIFPRAYKQVFGLKLFKFFDAYTDPGWKNSDPGSGIKILDPQH